MKRIGWLWLVSSLALIVLTAAAETRPQYGGTLQITMRAAPMSLDPANSSVPDSFARRTLTSLMFDTLVVVDESGRLKPGLADSWQATRGNQRWQFRLHPGVKFHDGTTLTGEIAASSLRLANASWNVSADRDSVIIECENPDPEMLAEVALSRNAIAKRVAENNVIGTGPMHPVDWQPGKKLTLAAQEDYWRGRPFLDGIEIELGKSFRDQTTSFELGKADLIEVAPEQSHHALQAGRRAASSAPAELLALLFPHDASSHDEQLFREALALSVERGSILSVLLQGTGQPAAGLLPTWISGYGFVFPTEANLAKARQLRDQVRTLPTRTLGYDGGDSLARLLAERMALNAKDAGLSLQPTSSVAADLRLVRLPIASGNPWIALQEIVAELGLSPLKSKAGPAEELFSAEKSTLDAARVIPLFHLPVSYASALRLRNWTLRMDGSLDLSRAWLGNTKP